MFRLADSPFTLNMHFGSSLPWGRAQVAMAPRRHREHQENVGLSGTRSADMMTGLRDCRCTSTDGDYILLKLTNYFLPPASARLTSPERDPFVLPRQTGCRYVLVSPTLKGAIGQKADRNRDSDNAHCNPARGGACI